MACASAPSGALQQRGFHQNKANRLLGALIGAGFVSKDHPGWGWGRTSIYHLHLPPLVRR
jgi:hypothetical protein